MIEILQGPKIDEETLLDAYQTLRSYCSGYEGCEGCSIYEIGERGELCDRIFAGPPSQWPKLRIAPAQKNPDRQQDKGTLEKEGEKNGKHKCYRQDR